jgi:hypothetical protein
MPAGTFFEIASNEKRYKIFIGRYDPELEPLLAVIKGLGPMG